MKDFEDTLTFFRGGEERWRLVLLAASVTRWLSFEDIAHVLKDPAYCGVGRPMKETRTSRIVAELRRREIMAYSAHGRYRLTHRGRMLVSYAVIRNEWSAKDLVGVCEALQTMGRRVWAQDRVLAPEFQRLKAVHELGGAVEK